MQIAKHVGRRHARLQWALAAACVVSLLATQRRYALAQTPAAPAAPPARVLGTVTSVADGRLVVAPDSKDKGAAGPITITLDTGARVMRLAPGSTDLKSAEPAAASDIAAGDRVLALGAPGTTADQFVARRVVLMKSTAISQRNEATEAEWQRGGGGIVRASDPAQGTLTIASGARTVAVHTTGTTIFRRYSSGSVRFADATKSSFGDIHAGDQVRVRGARSENGSSIDAAEIVSGSFDHVSGTILTIDSASRQVTLKDLRTKRVVTVEIAQDSGIHTLPPDVAERLAARAKRRAGGAKGNNPGAGAAPNPPPAVAGTAGEDHGQRPTDLNQVVARLPETPLNDLHKGSAVMIVAIPKGAADHLVAVTVLGGVEAILAASPNGEADETLSPWNLGGMPEGGS